MRKGGVCVWLQLTEGIEARGRANWKLAGARRAALMPPDHTGHLTTLIVAHSASTTQGGNPSFLQILGQARSSLGSYIKFCKEIDADLSANTRSTSVPSKAERGNKSVRSKRVLSPTIGQRHKLMLPYPMFCSSVAGLQALVTASHYFQASAKSWDQLPPHVNLMLTAPVRIPFPHIFSPNYLFFRHFCHNLILSSYFLWSCVRCPPKLGAQASSDNILLQPAK